MELYLKRYYWVAILASIACSALLVARTANTFVGSALEPAPLLGIDSGGRGYSPAAPVASVEPRALGHLFGIEPPAPVAEAGAEGGPDGVAGGRSRPQNVCWTCAPVKTGLRLQLLATMVSSDQQFSTALISDLDKMESGLYQIDDKIRGFDVYDIIRDPQRVVIVNNDTKRLEYIDATPGSGAALAVNTTLGVHPVPPPGGGDNDGIKRLADGKYEITHDKLEATLGDMNHLATEARIVPSFKNGQADGFKLFSIQPGSVYSAIGVENGDVIEQINGLDINSPEKALEAYARLKDSSNFDIQVERQGQPVTMSYSITP